MRHVVRIGNTELDRFPSLDGQAFLVVNHTVWHRTDGNHAYIQVLQSILDGLGLVGR